MMTYNQLLENYPEHAEEATERFAIMTIDGGMDDAKAMIETARRIKFKYGLFDQRELFAVDKSIDI